MTFQEVIKIVHGRYPDLFTEKEIKQAVRKWMKALHYDLLRLEAKSYPNFGTIVLTEEGKKNLPATQIWWKKEVEDKKMKKYQKKQQAKKRKKKRINITTIYDLNKL